MIDSRIANVHVALEISKYFPIFFIHDGCLLKLSIKARKILTCSKIFSNQTVISFIHTYTLGNLFSRKLNILTLSVKRYMILAQFQIKVGRK